MRIAPEGRPFILAAWAVLGGLLLLRLWAPALAWLPLAVWVVAFFRDPARPGPRRSRCDSACPAACGPWR